MKILSAILAILILFLTVQPVLTNSIFIVKKKGQVVSKCCLGKENIQSSTHKSQQERDNNCCNKGNCGNPFLSCANCCFIHFDNPDFLVVHVLIQNEKIRLVNEKIISSYIQDVWHPPQTGLIL